MNVGSIATSAFSALGQTLTAESLKVQAMQKTFAAVGRQQAQNEEMAQGREQMLAAMGKGSRLSCVV